MIWESLTGHTAQIEMFRRAIQRGRTSHAYLLLGPEGIGKRLFAKTLAQCLFCERIPDEQLDACGECRACRQMLAGTHPDLLQVACPAGKRELPIELIAGPKENRGREGLCHDLALRPMSAERRIAIIDHADRMNEESANALLKTLEEPPEGSILLLLSPGLDPLLPTIRSRCHPVHFASLTVDQIADLLVKLDWETDPGKAHAVAVLSDGSLETARQLLDPGLRELRDTLNSCLAQSPFNSLHTTDEVLRVLDEIGSDTAAQRQNATWLLRFAVEFFRGALRCFANPESDANDPHVVEFSLQLDSSTPETGDLLARLMDRCVDAEQHLEQMMPVPLCLDGLFDDLGRLLRGGVLSRV
jgi:DNA polymerase III subunit delta'